MLPLTVTLLFVVYVLKKTIDFWRAARGVGNIPGYRTLVTSHGIPHVIIPGLRGFCPGRNHAFRDKHSIFEQAGCDIVSQVSAFPLKAVVSVADAAVIQEIVSSRARFPKPAEYYAPLQYLGSNIITSEGEDWKRFRRIASPAFSERNLRLVWDEAVSLMDELFQDVWTGKDVITIDHCADFTRPIALYVLGSAAFGCKVSWREDVIRENHQMSFKSALNCVADHVLFRLLFPDRVMQLFRNTKQIMLAFDELKQYISEMIAARLNSEKVERHDLFHNLLEASSEEFDSTGMLSPIELMGNILGFLLAGHETTAHTLCFALALLALYPDEQELLYQDIRSVLPNGDMAPTYEQMPLLSRSTAVLNETARMFPSIPVIPKYSTEDTTLSTTNANGETVVVPIPAGTQVMINAAGLHYNPKYWEDPHSFKPGRFLKNDWDRRAYLPFSSGARSCLGRKFFEIEGTAVITMLISRYKITVKEEPQFAYETLEQRKGRLLDTSWMISLKPVRVPLVFTSRA